MGLPWAYNRWAGVRWADVRVLTSRVQTSKSKALFSFLVSFSFNYRKFTTLCRKNSIRPDQDFVPKKEENKRERMKSVFSKTLSFLLCITLFLVRATKKTTLKCCVAGQTYDVYECSPSVTG
ncbi:hypothetical protein L484_017301 [Morus notabilis]|uniref:Uncharacterized protein n=1 Tax=Morus notabilis TaxID=981085 RepID=W9RSN9_9ROSA|nr:hypothetical protein L484_017301 [Morus notabilis]